MPQKNLNDVQGRRKSFIYQEGVQIFKKSQHSGLRIKDSLELSWFNIAATTHVKCGQSGRRRAVTVKYRLHFKHKVQKTM